MDRRRDTLVVIPTYDEAASIGAAVAAVLDAEPRADVLVVDDASPDGTGGIADGLAAADDRVAVLHRRGKAGLGSAYLDGFAAGLDAGYSILGQFDADGSHPAAALPALRRAIDAGADAAIGSRWVTGGRVDHWPRRRQLLSRAGNAYARAALGLGVRDATAGFRLYRADALRAMDLTSVHAAGYVFQVEMTLLLAEAGRTAAEVPITFTERRAGQSKMSGRIVVEAMLRLTGWALVGRRWHRSRGGGR